MPYKIDWANEEVVPYRRKTMARIRAKNTKPELLFRKALWNMGIRYRLHGKMLPGNPDIFIRKYKLAIFIDGEFWHGFEWEKNKKRLRTRKEFWIEKIEKNMHRDQSADRALKKMGYEVMRFWSQDIWKNIGACVIQVQHHIGGCSRPWDC